MTPEEAIKELREASDSEVRYGDTDNHYDEVMKRVEAFDMAIKALEQQPCEDAISRQAVLEILEKEEFKGDAIYEIEKKLPSVQPKRQKGRWIDIQYFKADITYYRPKCPFCSIEPKEYSNFCPNCGARMEGNA